MYTYSKNNKGYNMNYWKKSDIKISTDSAGYMSAEHKWAGQLIDTGFYTDRNQCRKHAVEILMEMKEQES